MRIDGDIFLSTLCFALEMKSKPGNSNPREKIAVCICIVISTLIQLSNADSVYKSVCLYMSVIYHRCFRNQERKCVYRITLRGFLPVPVAARSKA